MTAAHEAEWKTRKRRIDPRLDALGWSRVKLGVSRAGPSRVEELPTDKGPADYALALDGIVVAIVEAKKVTVGPQEVLGQAGRYGKGLSGSSFNFQGTKVPFLYATNGTITWFRDMRHPMNAARRVADFHSPDAIRELLDGDFDGTCASLIATPHEHPWLRPYQQEANAAVEKAIADRKREMLVAMATGTGKTAVTVNQVYRLMKSGVARRILFLVDRRVLAAQTVRAFASFEAEPGIKFDKVYEVYSSRFQQDDFGEDEKFDPKVMPNSYLTDPKPGLAFVYVCTIQRMAISILGRQAFFGLGDEPAEEDAEQLTLPIHAFDVIIADECHRGYTAAEQSVWRSTLDHFDAIKVGLTATPAQHTTSYFRHLVFRYDYRQAVRDGYLVDYDVVNVRSDVRMNGVFLQEGEQVEIIDPNSGLSTMDQLEDERAFQSEEIEKRITAPDSNAKILAELRKYTDQHEERYGRFPKVLIFAVNDLPHTSHADQLVRICRETFGRGDDFVQKITGRVDRPLQRIREFRNRPNPGIAVTVDLLTTGVDIPDLEFLVFLRPVKSRILFEQMLGRGTRKGERFRDKSHFTVFDCFDGTLLAYFKQSTGITAEPVEQPTRTIAEVIEDIWQNRDRDYNIGCLVKRLHRIEKQMSGDARALFVAYIPDEDLGAFARSLPRKLRTDFAGTMKVLRDPSFQDLLVNYPRAERLFWVAGGVVDQVESEWLVRDGAGNEHKPGDYLAAFAKFVQDNPAHIEAIRILLGRPREWSGTALTELRTKLAATTHRFTVENLQKAHQIHHHRALVDIISMVKHAADERAPLLTAAERVDRAMEMLRGRESFTPDQEKWLGRIREHLRENLSIEVDDFELLPIFEREGGLGAVRKAFGTKLDGLVRDLNEAMAA